MTIIIGDSLSGEIKSFHGISIWLRNNLHYSWYREKIHSGCVPGHVGLSVHFLSFRGILFLILKSFHSTPTHQSLSWAFWNESCGQRNQPEPLHPQTSTPNVASPTEDCGGCKGQKPGAQEGGRKTNLLWSCEYYLVLLNSGFKYQLLFLCIFLKYAWHTLMQENLSLHMCLGWSRQFDLFSSFPP